MEKKFSQLTMSDWERPLDCNLGDRIQMMTYHLLKIVVLHSLDWLNGGNAFKVPGELHFEGDFLVTVLAFDILSKLPPHFFTEFVKNAEVTPRIPLVYSGFVVEFNGL